MLQFKQTDTEAILILTLTENVSIASPYYLFAFKHVLTKQTVLFVKNSADDESSATVRYNQFTINPSVLFAGYPIGEWHYIVYEQASSTNTDITLTGDPLEYGKLRIDRDPAFSFTTYNEAVTFNSYNG